MLHDATPNPSPQQRGTIAGFRTRPLALLLYSHFFPPSIGGVETIVLSLGRGLAELRDSNGAREFEVTLVTQTPAENYDDSALPFRVLRQPGLFQLWRRIRKADVVHVAGPALAPLVLTCLSRKPLVIEHHGYQATCPNGLLFHHPSKSICPGHFEAGNYLECLNCNWKVEGPSGAFWLLASTFLRRACSHKAARNIAPSNHVASRQRLPRTTVIVHGVEDPSPQRVAFSGSLARDEKSFAYLGRLVVEKGLTVVLEAARLLRAEGCDVHILLIGDGPQRPELEALIKQNDLGSCVRITGYLTGVRLTEALSNVRVAVMPSVWEETAGLAVLEQMVCGRPVIASAIGGLGEIVNGAALTFPPKDPAALAEAMRRILDEPGLAPSLGALGRQRVLQSFSFNGMIDAHVRVYRKAFAKQQG